MKTNPPAWIAEYCGRPFAREADGPDAYDCWGLVRAVYRARFGIIVPAVEHAPFAGPGALHAAADLPEVRAMPWREIPVESARAGDVLAYDLAELHVGLVVSPEWMLHARQGAGVQPARWRRAPWRPLCAAAYRHEGVPDGQG